MPLKTGTDVNFDIDEEWIHNVTLHSHSSVLSYFIEKARLLQVLRFHRFSVGMYLLSVGISGFGDFLTMICGICYALHVVLITTFSKKTSEYKLLTTIF